MGIIAAQSIGEPGTQLTMRTFHIGGTASSTIEKNKFEAQNAGRVILNRVRAVTNRDGAQLVLGKSGQLTIVDPQGREREKYILPNGARLMVHDGQEVTKGVVLAEWDPFNEPFVSEEDGDPLHGHHRQQDRAGKGGRRHPSGLTDHQWSTAPPTSGPPSPSATTTAM